MPTFPRPFALSLSKGRCDGAGASTSSARTGMEHNERRWEAHDGEEHESQSQAAHGP